MRSTVSGVAIAVFMSSVVYADSALKNNGIGILQDNLKNMAAEEITGEINKSLAGQLQSIELEATGFENGKPQYSITTVLPLLDDQQDGYATFFQGRYGVQDGRDTMNLGLGQRFILNHGTVIAGLNAFYDYEFGMEHKRVGVGGEILTSVGDLRLNNYWAISGDRFADDGSMETALNGYDAEIGVPLPYLPTTRVYAKTFKWFGVYGAGDLKGETYSVKADLPWGFAIEGGRTSYQAYKDDRNFITLTFNVLDLDPSRGSSKGPYISQEMFPFTDVTQRRFEKVRRENNIVKQISRKSLGTTVIVFEGV